MKIGNSIEGIKPDAVGPSGSRAGATSGVPVSPAEATDRIELSEASRSLAGAGNPDEIRADKVQQVKDALARGEFPVDAQVVADKMIMESAQLLQRITGGAPDPKHEAEPGKGK